MHIFALGNFFFRLNPFTTMRYVHKYKSTELWLTNSTKTAEYDGNQNGHNYSPVV